MMGAALPQTPAQTGLASILAAIGTAAPANGAGDEGGFEQLFTSLPGVGTPSTANMPGTANPFATLPATTVPAAAEGLPAPDPALPAPAAAPTPPAAALFGMPQPGVEMPVEAALTEQAATRAPVAATRADTVPAADAAVAASLLIAVATPMKPPASSSGKAIVAPAAEGDTATGDETAAQPAAIVGQPIAQQVSEAIPPSAAATIVAAAMPAGDKLVSEKTARPAAAPRAAKAETLGAAQPVNAPKPEATQAQQPAATFSAVEPKTAKPVADLGASMTVLFAQPDVQGAAPLAEAAKAAPVAERTLDLTSDDQWIAQLAADIAATKSDKGELSFRLMPRHLGRLDVSMLSGDEGVSVRLDTHHEATATIVQAAQPRLVEDLRQQGVRVADAQVTHTPAETGRQQQNQGQGRSSASDASHLIETASEQADPTHDERAADRRGRFA